MKRTALLVVLAAFSAAPAMAHTGTGIVSGFVHPFFGADHLIAMSAVGAWAAMLGGRALWMLPLAFLAAMASGAALGIGGLALPLVETTIAASAWVLASLLFARIRMPLWSGLGLVAFFAVAHGHAHGSELPAMADPVIYAAGFLAATALVMALGALAFKSVQSFAPVKSTLH